MNSAPLASSGRFRFGELTIDLGQRRLHRGKSEIELPKLSFDLLAALVSAAPNSLSTDELLDRVWAGAVVSPATIAKRIELLRQALGDDSQQPRYVALVRGHGYRLIPDVEEVVAGRSQSRAWRVATIAIGVLAAAAAAWLVLYPDVPPPDKSVAVLPFVSLSEGAEDEIFADGLTEELSHELAQHDDLKVTGRTSSFYYKGRNEDLRVIGETLGVANLLEGSVRRSGDKLRVTAQLIGAADGFHLWSETYDRRMDDVLDIQQDIARSVAARLRATLDMSVGAEDKSHLPDPQAYALYLKAVSLSPYGNAMTLGEAQEFIEQAVELDPGFAPAWNRLAAIHGRRMFFRDPDYPHAPQEGVQILLDAVDKALAIDPDSGEAYANLGGVAWVFEGDAAKAAPLIEKAVALDPWNLDVIAYAAEFAKFIGRLDESLALEELLVDRDPLCLGCRIRLAMSYLFTGRFEDAEREFLTLRAGEGEGFLWSLGVVYLFQGRPAEALASFDQMAAGNYLPYLLPQGRAMALRDLGRPEESDAALAELIDGWGKTHPLEVAKTLAYVERFDEAFETLFSALPEETIELQTQYPTPLFNKLHGDSRWHELLQRIGRAPEQVEQIPFTLNTVLDP